VIAGKRGVDSFVSTNLDFSLRSKGITTIVFGGFLTNCCVESTMRTGYEHGHRVLTLTDCMAATSLEQHDNAIAYGFRCFRSRPRRETSSVSSATDFVMACKITVWVRAATGIVAVCTQTVINRLLCSARNGSRLLAARGHLAHLAPAVLRHLNMDDFRSLGNQVGHPRHRGPEVLGVDVRLARLAGGECLHQHELVRVVNTAGLLEEQVAFFVPGGLGEFVGELQPLVASVGADRPLDNDEDHGCVLPLRAPAGAV
jgi:hypothetical protein